VVLVDFRMVMVSLHNINLVFITETKCVYCAVRTESLNIMNVEFFCHSPNIADLLPQRPWFCPQKIHVNCVVEKVAVGQVLFF